MKTACRLRKISSLLGLLLACWVAPAGADLYVAPNGTSSGDGSRKQPLDFRTPFTTPGLVKPGDTVWISAGRYEIGKLEQNRKVRGTREKPIVFRAAPGARATIVGALSLRGDYTWVWGLEVTGGRSVSVNGGDGVKLINLVIHDNRAVGISGWDVGDDHEYYGNIIFNNGYDKSDRGHCHAFYVQNTSKHTTKKLIDNILFYSYSLGIQIYGQSPTLRGFHVEGNIVFGNGFASETNRRKGPVGQQNILLGGFKPISKVVLRNNCTYHPSNVSVKRSVDVGYTAKGNRDIVIEGNYFMGGRGRALEVKKFSHAKVTGNTFWSTKSSIVRASPLDKSTVTWDRNTYIANGSFDLASWRKSTGFDANSKLVEGKGGRPSGTYVFKRVNRYEPRRVHLAIYNWDRESTVAIDASDILEPGQSYEVKSVWDFFGKPVTKGKYAGKPIAIPMAGHKFGPEFGAFVLLRPKSASRKTLAALGQDVPIRRPRPGEALSVSFYPVAKAGSFDPKGTFAIASRRTRRGYEAAYIRIPGETGQEDRYALFSIPAQKILPWSGTTNGILKAVPASRPTSAVQGVPLACVSGHRGLRRWTRGAFADGPLAKGVEYGAKTTKEGVYLIAHAKAEPKPRRYGPVRDTRGRKLERAVALTTNANGDALILGIRDKELVLAFVEDLFIDEHLKHRTAKVHQHFKEAMKSALRVKSYSLTGIAPYLDRPFDALMVAGDGKVYFGTMPHHPTKGTLIFQFDPKSDRLVNLGDIDELSREKDPTDLPGMMHSVPVEVGGYVFFTGQDPFYGKGHLFPELPRGARYPGSHALGYDTAKGQFRDFGIPAPGLSAFWMAADPKRGFLYLRMGYHAGQVHRLNVKTGKIDNDLFHCPTNTMVVGANGKIYYSRGKDLACFDPDARSETVVATGVGGSLRWIKGQDGNQEIYALRGRTIYRLDTPTGKVQPSASFSGRVGSGDIAYRNGTVYKASLQGGGQGSNRACHLLTLNLKTGKTTDHGIIMDQAKRIVQAVWAVDVGADGTVYMAGPVFPKAGDPYSPRLKRWFLNDNRFMVLKGLKP